MIKKGIVGFLLVCFMLFLVMDILFPLPKSTRIKSVIVVAEDGTPLRAFADDKGVWRYPVTLDEVSPLYIEALINYEDRWFYYHLGINILSMFRAVSQLLWNQRTISGGSTLTMQVARILDSHEKNISGKLKQMFRALQLEWHYSKDEILTIYLNLAPYGGPIEGVQTASFAYLNKPALELSHAEAALLAVLPQSPSRIRPDRHPKRAQRYRDKVLDRLLKYKVWDDLVVNEAKMEKVNFSRLKNPLLAPLFARLLKQRERQAGQTSLARIETPLDSDIQFNIEDVLFSRVSRLPEQVSAAVLVMENKTGLIRGYAGSLDFLSNARFGHIDMIQAIRSPGSTLKPFLYAMALNQGLIHSESLLSDAPIKIKGYSPANFQKTFQGAVSVTEALQKSLNVPAVDMIERLSVPVFISQLHNAGLKLRFPPHSKPNLAVILGGTGTSLIELVRLFSSMAREGVTIKPRYSTNDPIVERRLVSAGASWIIRDMLSHIKPPNGMTNAKKIAWKTGTSYGFRDAWAIGVSDRYTVGVWTGRPDGTPSPGRYGSFSATPILFDIMQFLPHETYSYRKPRPDSVSKVTICWPLGTAAEVTHPEHCHIKRKAWVLNGNIPPTLPSLNYRAWSAGIKTYWVDSQGKRVRVDCSSDELIQKNIAKWPTELYPWLDTSMIEKTQKPSLSLSCGDDDSIDIDIIQPDEGSIVTNVQNKKGDLLLEFRAEGSSGTYYWWLNGELIGSQKAKQSFNYSLSKAGKYHLSVISSDGGFDQIDFQIRD